MKRDLIDPELHGLLDIWPQITLDETMLPAMRDSAKLPVGAVVAPGRVLKQRVVVPR